MVPGVPVARYCSLLELPELLAESDYVMLCINYTPDRYHMIGTREIGMMKQGAFLVNVARGGLLDQEALLSALRSGHMAGAGLDVFREEPFHMDHPLFSENVIATPHIAGVTDVSYEGMAREFAGNIQRYAAGEEPKYLANAPEWLRSTKPRS